MTVYFPQLTQLWNGDLTPRDGEDEREEICTTLTKADPKISKGSKPSLPKTIYKVILLSLFFFSFLHTQGTFQRCSTWSQQCLGPIEQRRSRWGSAPWWLHLWGKSAFYAAGIAHGWSPHSEHGCEWIAPGLWHSSFVPQTLVQYCGGSVMNSVCLTTQWFPSSRHIKIQFI